MFLINPFGTYGHCWRACCIQKLWLTQMLKLHSDKSESACLDIILEADLLEPELCASCVEGKLGMFSGRTPTGFCVNHV